jgi:hypothetical protein
VPKITEYANQVAAILEDWKVEFQEAAKKVSITGGYFLSDVKDSDTLYIDVLPDSWCNLAKEAVLKGRRAIVLQGNYSICIVVRKQLPEKFTRKHLDSLVSVVESVSDLMMQLSWDGARCSSVAAQPHDPTSLANSRLFSATLTAVIEVKC